MNQYVEDFLTIINMQHFLNCLQKCQQKFEDYLIDIDNFVVSFQIMQYSYESHANNTRLTQE